MSNQEKKTLFKILGFFCFVLILPFPTGFYYLSRAIVFAGAIYAASVIKDLKSSKGETIYLLMIAIAFIYNPILMVFLYQKAIWIVINIISALVFFNAASLFNNSQTGKIPTANRKTKPIVSRQKGINNSRVKARSKSTNNYPYELKMDSFATSQDYLQGEVVQLNGIYVGEVLSWDSIFYVLRLENVDRKLLKGDYLLGERSNANFSIIAIDPIEKKVNEDQLQLFSREETISEQEEIAETTIDDSDSSFEEHNQRMKEQNEAIYGSEKVSHNKKEPIITWEKNTKKDSGSKLDNALAYFFEFAFFCLDKIKNNQSLSETDKYIFRKEYLQVKGLEDYGVMFFSRIEIESLSFANYHFEKNMEFKIKDAWANREKNLSDPLITEVRNHLANILKI